MRVPCPQCNTVFNLPDNAATPGRKLRCAVCQNVFPLESTDNSSFTVSEYSSEFSTPSKSKSLNPKVKKILKILSAFIGVLILLFSILMAVLSFTSLLDGQKETIASFLPDAISSFFMDEALDVGEIIQGEIIQTNEPVDRIGLLELRDMRQYIVNNEKVGKIAVVEGIVYNGFDNARGSINLEASLYDINKKLLFSKSQLAGTSVSLFQLQVLPQEELEATLTDSQAVLQNNSAIAPGASVPFMILFHAPPETANEFGVRVTSADIINAAVFPTHIPKPEIPAPIQPAPVQEQPTSMDQLLTTPQPPAVPAPLVAPPAQELTPHTGDNPPANMSSMDDLLNKN